MEAAAVIKNLGLDVLAQLFGREITDAQRDILLAWEDGVREQVLATQVEPCSTPPRWRLPDERHSLTHRFHIKGDSKEKSLKGYLTVGCYDSGRVGEMFLVMQKEGSFASGLLDGIMTCISIGLQYGIPLSTFTSKFKHTRFEPEGMVRACPDGAMEGMKFAKSVLDYLSHYLDHRFPSGKIRTQAEYLASKKPQLTAVPSEEKKDAATHG